MTQTTAEQRAELRRLVDQHEIGARYRSEYPEHAAIVALLNAGPALLADAEALAAREADDAARKERTRAALTRLAKLSEDDICRCPRCGAAHPAKEG